MELVCHPKPERPGWMFLSEYKNEGGQRRRCAMRKTKKTQVVTWVNAGRWVMHVKKQSSRGERSFTALSKILTVMATYDRGRAMEAGSDWRVS